jgi:putative transposase
MARPLRIEYHGALYHVTSRGDGREDIYLCDEDRDAFIEVLADVYERFNWVLHAYCLMSNHFHLLVETPDANLSLGMRQLNGVYTQRFNRAHNRVGHVFQGRYKAILVQKESYLLELARYIVLNPVRARMARSARDWPWSSYRATAGFNTRPKWLEVDWILSAFGRNKGMAQERYREYVSAGRNQPKPWDHLVNQIYLGSEAFVAQAQEMLEQDRDLSEVPARQKRPVPKRLEEYGRQARDRNHAILLAYQSGGYSMKELGVYFGVHYSRVSRIIKTEMAKRKT